MKKILMKITMIAGIAIIASGFTAITYELQINTAEVDQEGQLSIFIRSKPVKKYKFLGKVNMPEIVWRGKPEEMMNIAVRRATKQYPSANGIIFQNASFGKVDAILIE